jgi:transcriptional antiterminator RfaH
MSVPIVASSETRFFLRWHVAQTLPRAEARAASELDAQGYNVFLPQYLKKRSHARKITWAPAPLFPGYLFVACRDATQSWRPINGTIGVTRLIMGEDGPASIDERIVQALKDRRDEKGHIALSQRSSFAKGESVRITEGALAATLGLFNDIADRDRVSVLVELLGRKVRVLLNEAHIEKAA